MTDPDGGAAKPVVRDQAVSGPGPDRGTLRFGGAAAAPGIGNGHGDQLRRGEVLFLGERASSLVKKFGALAPFQGMTTWFSEEAVSWARRVGKAMQRRDELVHRPPVFAYSGDIEGGDSGRLAWHRSRRSHKVEYFDETALFGLVDELAELEHEAANKLVWASGRAL